MYPTLLALLAASTAPVDVPRKGQNIQAHRTTGPIRLDGHLDEADWQSAPVMNQFLEYYPTEHGRAPEETDVRLLYDDHYLYVGFDLHLKNRAGMRTPFVRRDKVNATHDYVQIYLDPQDARRGSYLFRVNARGTKADGFQNEAAQTETLDPDYNWDVVSNINDHGWSAELRIPLSTLRISRSGKQKWAVIVTRGVPRQQNVQMATAPFPHSSQCFLCYAGEVEFADMHPDPQRLIAAPSITATRRTKEGDAGSGSSLKLQPSLDVKWLPFDGAAVDLTINPDFSQVEADQNLLTANQRFALSLPEKRPFFREGADLVTTTVPVIYTRSVAAPDAGLRFTKRGSDYEGTAFVARDSGRPGIIEPGLLGSSIIFPDFDSYDGFVRVRRNVQGGAFGGLAVVRANTDGSYNAVAGIDASHSSGTDFFSGQVLVSRTQDPDRPDLSPSWTGGRFSGYDATLSWGHTGPWTWDLRYDRVGNGFRSWLGYVPRVGYQSETADLYRPFYFANQALKYFGPFVSATLLQGLDKGHETDPAAGFKFSGYRNLNGTVTFHPDAVVMDLSGREHHTRFLAWTAAINPGPRIPLVSFIGQHGKIVDFADGNVVDGTTLTLRVITRPVDRFELEARHDVNILEGRPGETRRLLETANRLTGTYFFNARFYAILDLQTYRSDRRNPAPSSSRTTNFSFQFNWDVSRDFQAYWGVRRAGNGDAEVATRGRTTEVYLKISHALHL